MSTENLDRAIAAATAVVATVTPEQLSLTTPCASWDVKGLLNHMIGATHFFANAVEGTPPPAGDAPDFTAGDVKANYSAGTSRLQAAFGAEGVLEKMLTLPFGTMPGAAFAGMAATDVFTHAWDLAKATGQSTDLDPELSARLLEQSKVAIQAGFRGPEGAPFGPEATAPAESTNADRLAAFLGRTV